MGQLYKVDFQQDRRRKSIQYDCGTECGCSVSEKYSDRRRTAEATEGFDKLVQDGMARKFDAVVVDSIFRCGRTLPFAIEALQRTFYPLGIQFAVVEDDFCSIDKTAEEVAEYFNGKTIDKIHSLQWER